MPKSKKSRKANRNNKRMLFCKLTDCYYNDGKFHCVPGGRIETKGSKCIFYRKGISDES